MCQYDELKKRGVSVYSKDKKESLSLFPYLINVTDLVDKAGDNVFLIQYFRLGTWDGQIKLLKIPQYKFEDYEMGFSMVKYYIPDYAIFYDNICDVINNALKIYPDKKDKIFKAYMDGIYKDNYESLKEKMEILNSFNEKYIYRYLKDSSISNLNIGKCLLLDYLFDRFGKEKVWNEIILDKLFPATIENFLKNIDKNETMTGTCKITLAVINNLEDKLTNDMFYDGKSKKLHVKMKNKINNKNELVIDVRKSHTAKDLSFLVMTYHIND